MMLCSSCHRRPARLPNQRYCRACHRAYMRDWRGPRRITRVAKARAWLTRGTYTNAQLAELLGVSRAYAAVLRGRAAQWHRP